FGEARRQACARHHVRRRGPGRLARAGAGLTGHERATSSVGSLPVWGEGWGEGLPAIPMDPNLPTHSSELPERVALSAAGGGHTPRARPPICRRIARDPERHPPAPWARLHPPSSPTTAPPTIFA